MSNLCKGMKGRVNGFLNISLILDVSSLKRLLINTFLEMICPAIQSLHLKSSARSLSLSYCPIISLIMMITKFLYLQLLLLTGLLNLYFRRKSLHKLINLQALIIMLSKAITIFSKPRWWKFTFHSFTNSPRDRA